jgi:hypothetical protein
MFQMYPFFGYDLEYQVYIANRDLRDAEEGPDRTASVIAVVATAIWVGFFWAVL